MTRTFNEKIRCPQCGKEHTQETDFERWIRNNPNIDSRSGICRFDLDVLLHKYKFVEDGKGDRTIQCMMFVEVKTFMAVPSEAQVDTLSTLNQILRNRRCNIHSSPRRQIERQATRVMSKMLGKNVTVLLYGGHLLQIDGTHPENSSVMLWDFKPITIDMLTDLLTFRRDPDRPQLLLDHRRRSRKWSNAPRLF